MKFNFRKITSAMASTALLGLTVATAAAANYPVPFVQNGNADTAIVFGSNQDLSAVTDISASLSSALAGSTNAAGASDDAYPVFTSSTPLQLNNSLNSVRTTVTDTSLPSVLGDTDFSGNVDAEATFQLVLGANPRVIYADEPTSSSDHDTGLFFATTAANYLYNATVTFDEAVNFTVADSEGESLSLFGQDFTVSSATDTDTLVLFKSAETLFLSVGSTSSVPSQTVEVEDETYTIELVAASDTSATIKVTNSAGQSDQKEIDEAASKKILGVEVAVNTADESTATNVIQAEILVGANRITLEENSEVKVGTDNTPIDGTNVDFAAGSSPAGMTQFTIQVFAPSGSEDFLASGDELVDPVFGSFRVLFEGLAVNLDDTESRDLIEIAPSGTDKAALSFTSWQGDRLTSWEFLNNESFGAAFLGDQDNYRIRTLEQAIINESGYAVVGNEDEGVLVELITLTNSSSTSAGDDDVVFQNVITDDQYSGSITSEGAGTINIEGGSYTFTYRDDRSGNGQHVRLNFPDTATAGHLVVYPTIETAQGANIALYEPLTIDLNDVNGLGQDAVRFRFPDGDGYTDVDTTSWTSGDRMWNFTFGSTVTTINTTAGGSASGAIGTLTYNFTIAAGTLAAAGNTTTLYLVEGNANVARPGIVLFEEQDESDVYNTVVVETSGAGISDNGVSVSEASFSWNRDTDMEGSAWGNTGTELDSQDDMFVKLDQWGTLVTTDQSDSDQYSMTISYPDEQAVAMIYIDSLVEGSGSGTLGNVNVMDDELAQSGMSGKNLIVVGGSCVNTAASTLLGNAGCGSSWTAATGAGSGDWIIKTFANPWASSKVATLVAGWEQGDTANAATYLTTQEPEITVGEGMTGTTSTSAVPIVA